MMLESSLGVLHEPTIQTLIRAFADLGYHCNLHAHRSGEIRCVDHQVEVPIGRVQVERIRRLEGVSDPGASCIVLGARLLRSPSSPSSADCLGVLVIGYGPGASLADAEALGALELGAASVAAI